MTGRALAAMLALGPGIGLVAGPGAAWGQRAPYVTPESLVNRERLCRAPGVRCDPAPSGPAGSAATDPAAAEAARMEADRRERTRTACERQWGNLEAMVRHCEERAPRDAGRPGPAAAPTRQ